MKLKKGFFLRKIGGAHVAVAMGELAHTFYGIVNLNESGAFLFRLLQTGADRQTLIDAILEEYATDEATAACSVDEYLAQLRGAGLLES